VQRLLSVHMPLRLVQEAQEPALQEQTVRTLPLGLSFLLREAEAQDVTARTVQREVREAVQEVAHQAQEVQAPWDKEAREVVPHLLQQEVAVAVRVVLVLMVVLVRLEQEAMVSQAQSLVQQ
jgi:vacuolar-type H+-ATPase subunit D/Vma8